MNLTVACTACGESSFAGVALEVVRGWARVEGMVKGFALPLKGCAVLA